MDPHVEVGKEVIHRCVQCNERVHTFCISKNDDGVMLCAGCDPMHSYGDAITMCHQVEKEWKEKLVKYYNDRDGIPENMCFLAGEGYLASQERGKKQNSRKSRTSSNAARVTTEVEKTNPSKRKRATKKVNSNVAQRKSSRKRVSGNSK